MSENKITALPAFATPIWGFQLNEHAELNEDLFFYSYKLKENSDNAPEKGEALPWTSNPISIQEENTKSFIEAIAPTVQKALSETGVNLEFYNGNITNLQASILPTYSSLVRTFTPNSYLSAVYVVKTFEKSGEISFHDPRSANAMYSPLLSQYNNLNAQQINMPLEEGKIFIFPSYLHHTINTNLSDKGQVLLKFNINLAPKK